ncbi:MAG TPA: hypothetical protein VKR23_11300 [Gaiellaceae bacterium]|nr:hypothetical protein [Gaiellaceae bacterium]
MTPANAAGTAFGLGLDAVGFRPFDTLSPGGGARRVEVVLDDQESLLGVREASVRSSLVDRRFPSGRLMLQVEQVDGHGYWVAAPRYGRHLISADGRRIRSALPRVPELQWQRLFFAQVLPLAAALQGLEVLHASAVVLEGRALGFVAASGIGKTSLAVNLAAAGAELLTDDVLALDVSKARPTAFAGARLVNVAPHEYAALDAATRRRIGSVIGRTAKVHLRPVDARPNAPLAALYFLRRDSNRSGSVDIRVNDADDSRLVLGSGFITYLSEPRHLIAHLEAAGRIASAVPVFLVDVPGDRSSGEVAAAVAAHATSELA